MEMVRRIRSGRVLLKSQSNSREKYEEIAKRVDSLLAEHPQMSLESAVIQVIEGGAPKFYITPESAKLIIYDIRKRWKRR